MGKVGTAVLSRESPSVGYRYRVVSLEIPCIQYNDRENCIYIFKNMYAYIQIFVEKERLSFIEREQEGLER